MARRQKGASVKHLVHKDPLGPKFDKWPGVPQSGKTIEKKQHLSVSGRCGPGGG